MIYLASHSKARQEILKRAGVRFKVIHSDVDEMRSTRGSYALMVKHNAAMKARDAASRVSSGVVIAADTIVVQGKRVYGKPANLKDALSILKALSGSKQTVYTGIAVYNKKTDAMSVEVEKSVLYMDSLNDREIQAYFKRVAPLDKAGAFDIQGQGAFFIRRIEGCFYNIVGLPLWRLYRMCKKMNIPLFAVLLMAAASTFFLSGCSAEYNIATREEESLYYNNDKEVKLGASMSRAVEKEYKLADDPLMQKRVEDIGKRIVAVCDRKDIDYHFKVLDEDEVNAVSLPGGWVYINKGLMEKAENDDQLAGVIAHEVGHIVARHSIKKLQAMMGYNFLRILTIAVPGNAGKVGATADAAFTELMLGYSREDELLADQCAARYAQRAGFDPHGMVTFLQKLDEINKHKPLRPKSYFKTHPYVPDRIRVVKQAIGEPITFSDYINVEQQAR
jgi:MAF protein